MTTANDILMGSGAPAAKFDHIGASVSGVLVREPEARQQTEFRTGVPLTWQDGSPKMQVVVQLATDERDPQRPNDDGTRAVYIKGKYLTDAIRQAVRASGADGLHTGGRLTITYVADGPAEAGLNAPKLYQARYVPPAASFAGVDAPTAAFSVPATGPAAPAGVDPAMWARLNPAQQQAVLAASGASGANTPPF